MKIDKKLIVLMLLVPICSGIISSYYFSKSSNKPVEIRKKLDVKDDGIVGTNTLSVYLETEEGSGEYRLSEEDVFLHDGYYFNEEKSKCENGGTLAYDKSTGNIRMSTMASDRCFVYFDKGVPLLHKTCNDNTLACQIAKKYGTDNTLYLHDSTLENGAGDNSYRYAGASDSVNNFVCFGSDADVCQNDNLYRIIGVFDNKVKLIKYDYATKEQLGTDGDYYGSDETPSASYYKGSMTKIPYYRWNYSNGNSSTNDWTLSRLNTINLNTNYLNNIGSDWASKIAMTTWNVGGGTSTNIYNTNAKITYDYEIGANKINKPYNAKIGLMYVSEYAYAAYPTAWTTKPYDYDNANTKANNWMYMGFQDWTISPRSDNTGHAFGVTSTGFANSISVNSDFGVRPSFNLESSVELLRGSGSMSDPYILKK